MVFMTEKKKNLHYDTILHKSQSIDFFFFFCISFVLMFISHIYLLKQPQKCVTNEKEKSHITCSMKKIWSRLHLEAICMYFDEDVRDKNAAMRCK